MPSGLDNLSALLEALDGVDVGENSEANNQQLVRYTFPQNLNTMQVSELIRAFLDMVRGHSGRDIMGLLGIRQTGPLSFIMPPVVQQPGVSHASTLRHVSNFGMAPNAGQMVHFPQRVDTRTGSAWERAMEFDSFTCTYQPRVWFREALVNLAHNLAKTPINPYTGEPVSARRMLSVSEEAKRFVDAVAQQVPCPFTQMIQQAVEFSRARYAYESELVRDMYMELTI